MKNIAIIPARGGSKRIPRKNIKPFMGKPIIAYSIEAALESGLFDEVMVSTDDEEIAMVARQYGAKVPFMRSAETASVLKDAYHLLTENHFDSVFTAVAYSYPVQRGLKIEDGRIRMVWPEYIQSRSQDLEMIYHDAGQFYISKVEPFYQHKDFWGANTGGIILSELEVQDLDTLTDWKLAEMKYQLLHTR